MTLCAYLIAFGMALGFTNDSDWRNWLGLGIATVALLIGMVKERMLIKKIRELGGDEV